jgi:uncharacterized protein involved in response to NO
VLTLEGVLPCIPGWCAATAHAREMLFGYAFAVVAGFLLGPQPLRTILALLLLWLGARIAFLAASGSWIVPLFDTTFIAATTWLALRRYAPSAKTWRNRALSVVIAALGLTGALGGLAFSLDAIPLRLLSDAALVLFATLLFFMGGRMIAPAVRGHVVRGGGRLEAGVQPQLEGAVLVCLFGALAGGLAGREAPGLGGSLAAVLLGVAGALSLVRLLRWRPWRCRTRPDLLMLMLGYGWLAIGLLLLAAARLALLPASLAVHALTIGALGSLTVTVMARTRMLYRFRDANRFGSAHAATLLMSGAAVARLLWAWQPDALAGALLWLAATLWAAACLTLLVVLCWTLAFRD